MMRIGIIGAMELEVTLLKEAMEITAKEERTGMEFIIGTLSGAEVVVVQCGVGKVNAAMCAQILVDCFEITHVINTGIAGSLNDQLDISDILVSIDALQHDMDVRVFGYEAGQVPGLPSLAFKADKQLVEATYAAQKAMEKDVDNVPKLISGRVVSGDQFISDQTTKNRLILEFHGDCCEMEGAAIAQVAFRNQIPFLILRAISDKADGSAELDYPTFEAKAAKDCAKLVVYILLELANC